MTTTPASAPTPALDRCFATLRRSSVTRSSDRVIAGVAAGVAGRLGVSRAIVRVAIVGLAIFGPGVLLYLLAWLMLPDAQGQIRLERAVRGGEGGSILLLVVGGLALLGALFGDEVGRGPGMHGHGGPWPLLIVAGIALLGWKKGWWQRHNGRGGHGGRGASKLPPAAQPHGGHFSDHGYYDAPGHPGHPGHPGRPPGRAPRLTHTPAGTAADRCRFAPPRGGANRHSSRSTRPRAQDPCADGVQPTCTRW